MFSEMQLTGNDVLHEMAGDESFLGNHQTLRVDMEQFNGEKTYAVYSTFFVENEASKYYAKVGGYSGDAGNEYKTHSAVTII